MEGRNDLVPIWNKYTLTIKEASEYFGIGEKKIRQMIIENPGADYILTNGNKYLIKRKKFESLIDDASSL